VFCFFSCVVFFFFFGFFFFLFWWFFWWFGGGFFFWVTSPIPLFTKFSCLLIVSPAPGEPGPPNLLLPFLKESLISSRGSFSLAPCHLPLSFFPAGSLQSISICIGVFLGGFWGCGGVGLLCGGFGQPHFLTAPSFRYTLAPPIHWGIGVLRSSVTLPPAQTSCFPEQERLFFQQVHAS